MNLTNFGRALYCLHDAQNFLFDALNNLPAPDSEPVRAVAQAYNRIGDAISIIEQRDTGVVARSASP